GRRARACKRAAVAWMNRKRTYGAERGCDALQNGCIRTTRCEEWRAALRRAYSGMLESRVGRCRERKPRQPAAAQVLMPSGGSVLLRRGKVRAFRRPSCASAIGATYLLPAQMMRCAMRGAD